MKKVVPIIVFVALCLIAGYVSRVLQAFSLEFWYPALIKSPLSPPDVAFPIVWAILYVLMGISAGLMWGVSSIYSRLLVTLFSLQLLLNILWSFCFFYMQSPLMGLVIILALDMIVLMYVAGSFVVNRLCGWLLVPYMLWLLFATYLNGYVAVYN